MDKSHILDNLNFNDNSSNRFRGGNNQEKNALFLKKGGENNNRDNDFGQNFRNRGYNGNNGLNYDNRNYDNRNYENRNYENRNYNNGRNYENRNYNNGRNYENRNYNNGRYYENRNNNNGERYRNNNYGGNGNNNWGGRRNEYDRKPDFGVRRGFNNDYQDSRRFYREREENNFNRNRQNDFDNNNNEQYEMEKEALYEKEVYQKNLKKKYSEVIEQIKIVFINEQLKEDEILQIIKKLIANPSLTIFEAMNLIYREVQIIKTLQFYNSGQKRKYGPNKDIIENEFDNFINRKDLKDVIQRYKVHEKGEDEDEKNKSIGSDESYLYFDNSDRRRQILKDEKEYFNYLPIYNPNKGNNNDDKDDDIYAKNENELLYHPLFYKTLMCKYCDLSDETIADNILCPYSHNILKDFRIIYDYKDEGICKFMKYLLESELFQFEDYSNYIDMSFEFNIDTFKFHKCQLDSECPNDYHLCPFYHSSIKGDEKRRPFSLFGYSGGPGDLCFNEKMKKYTPKKCVCGIFCQYIHSKNEYNYHPDHFRKYCQCKRKKVKGKCIYYKTCYGIHSDDNQNNSLNEEEEEEEEEENENKIMEEAKNDEEVIEKKTKVDMTFMVAKTFRCRKCQKVSKKGELIYFLKCKHFICMKCFRKLISKNSKNNKKEKEKEKEKLMSCPFCSEELKKGEIIKLSY